MFMNGSRIFLATNETFMKVYELILFMNMGCSVGQALHEPGLVHERQ